MVTRLIDDFDGEIVFAYSLYDETLKREIKQNYLNSIYSLFFAYERSKNIQSPRLLTKMIGDGRISFKEI